METKHFGIGIKGRLYGRLILSPAFLLVILCASLHEASAIVFKDTGDPNYNTQPPTGALAHSGWQWEGKWDSFGSEFLGTPIAPRFFITARHVGGRVGSIFTYRGMAYHTVAVSICPGADLNIWQVAETFPEYAPLYTETNEIGRHCVVFGCGTQRGEPVVVGGITNGWKWGKADGVQRWGENTIGSAVDGGVGFGPLLYCTFDRDGGPNECQLSYGDSSGATYIDDGTGWKLAGINYAVDGLFSFDGTTNTAFAGMLLDMSGLWRGQQTNWTYLPRAEKPNPSGFFVTRISQNLDWIKSVVDYTPGPDLRIAKIRYEKSNALISLETGANRLYRIEYSSNPQAGAWSLLADQVQGTGSIVTVTDVGGATNGSRFYRAVLVK